MVFLRDLGPTEVGGFGISAAVDPLLVEDFRLVRQEATAASVRFEDDAVADHFDAYVDQGLSPERFARIWVHTHPGESPRPSGTDERTLARVFGGCDWAAMFILARGGRTYARLRFAAGPGGELLLPVKIDYSVRFPASDQAGWAEEYAHCVLSSSDGPRDDLSSRDSGEPFAVAGAEPFGVSEYSNSYPPPWEFHDEREYRGLSAE